jgi:hypothetical protein
MRDALLRCEKHAAGNHGIISRVEALALGMTNRTIDLRLRDGAWIRMQPGIFRTSAFPETWRGKLRSALLWAGPGAYASHRSAAALYGLDGFPEGPIEITAPTNKSIGGVKVHRSKVGARVRVVDGIEVGWVERTLVEICITGDPIRCGLAVDDALRRKLTTLDRLWQELQGCTKGTRGAKTFRKLIEGRDDRDGKLDSKLEAKILTILRRIKGEAFDVQHPVVANGNKYRLDFFHARSVLGIEGHSFRWHFGDSAHDKDAERHNDLTLEGIRMLYVTWDQAMFRPNDVEAKVRRAIAQPSLSI